MAFILAESVGGCVGPRRTAGHFGPEAETPLWAFSALSIRVATHGKLLPKQSDIIPLNEAY